MGSIIGKTMEESFKKQQDFMLAAQKLQMERQLAMQNEMRERQMSMMIARSRDFFWYWVTFDTIATVGLTVGALKRRRFALLAPLVPLTIVTTYQWDMAYGPKMERMREMADRILDEERHLLEIPHGMPTFSTIEYARTKQKESDKPGHDLFL